MLLATKLRIFGGRFLEPNGIFKNQNDWNSRDSEGFNLRTYKAEGGKGQHSKVFLSLFSLEDKTPAPDVFRSCSFIPRAHFESRSVTVSFYGYEI